MTMETRASASSDSPGMVQELRAGRGQAWWACQRRAGVTEAPESIEGSRVWAGSFPSLCFLQLWHQFLNWLSGPWVPALDWGGSDGCGYFCARHTVSPH